MLNQEFIQAMKLRLMAEKAEVEAEIKDLSQPEAAQENPDVDDLAIDAIDDILQGSSLVVLKKLLEKINNALDRINNNNYGICLETGQPIPQQVLAEEPWAEVIPPILRQN
jgi:RNA polymerase-binding transcription factor DksA